MSYKPCLPPDQLQVCSTENLSSKSGFRLLSGDFTDPNFSGISGKTEPMQIIVPDIKDQVGRVDIKYFSIWMENN